MAVAKYTVAEYFIAARSAYNERPSREMPERAFFAEGATGFDGTVEAAVACGGSECTPTILPETSNANYDVPLAA
jgi:hypothetical protein